MYRIRKAFYDRDYNIQIKNLSLYNFFLVFHVL